MKQIFQKLFEGKATEVPYANVVTIVSGLPRSGTSMMMKMLEAGGIQPLIDNIREADTDNPKGYYEFERVKKLDKGDTEWLNEAQGKVVKVISALLEHLPPTYTYKVVFMHRNIEEILASQKKMLIRRGEATDKVSDDELRALFEMHKKRTEQWLQSQANVSVLDIDYNQLLEAPNSQVFQINQFFNNSLKAEKMLSIIDTNLYRNQSP